MERNSTILEFVHTDVCDLNGILTRDNMRYFVTFIDDFSKYSTVLLMKSKDEQFENFKVFKTRVENQLEKTIKRVRSDRGGEYTSNDINKFCEENGIIHATTSPYSPQSNGGGREKKQNLN